MKRYIKCATYERTYETKDKWFSQLADGDIIVYNPVDMPEDVFKMNGLGNVVDMITRELNEGDVITISRDNYTCDILITDEYANGNRGYVPIYPEYQTDEQIRSHIKNGNARSWRDITNSIAWLDIFRKPYKLVIHKGVY